MTISEKAIYLKGLADGLNFDRESAEGKLIAALIELTGEMAKKFDDIDEDVEYLNDYIEEIDEDLGEVEEYIFDDDECDCCDCDDDEDDEDDFDCDGNCECCDTQCCVIECPSCGERVHLSCDTKLEELVCPKCGEKLAILDEFEDEDK